jgi:hypothetical protein
VGRTDVFYWQSKVVGSLESKNTPKFHYSGSEVGHDFDLQSNPPFTFASLKAVVAGKISLKGGCFKGFSCGFYCLLKTPEIRGKMVEKKI